MDPTCSNRTAAQMAFGQTLRLFGLMHRVMRPYFQEFGLSQAQWAILRHIHRAQQEEGRKDGLRMAEIGQRLLIQPPSVTTVVRRLVKAGLVTQSTTPNDRRGTQLRLSRKGETLMRRILVGHPQQIRHVMGGLTDDELPVLNGLLERANAHLAAVAAKTPDTFD